MTNPTTNRYSTNSLLKAGGIAILAAVLANVLFRFLLGAVIPLASDFPPFSLGAIIIFTITFTLIGVGVLLFVNCFSANTMKVYNWIAVVALLVSLAPNFLGAANPAAIPTGGRGSDYLILILFHLVAAAAYLGMLNRLVGPSPKSNNQ